MKQFNFLILAFGLLLSANTSAQNELRIGINAGLNYPDIRGNELARYNNFKVGYLAGVSLDYSLTENLSVKSNINYERKIKELKLVHYNHEAERSGSSNYKDIYEYVNFPVLLKYEFFNSKIFANGGPFLNYLINNEIKPTFPIDDLNAFTELKKIDFGFSFGVGTNFSLDEKNYLTIEIRDDLGIIDTGGVPGHVDGTVKTNAINLLVGWNLGI